MRGLCLKFAYLLSLRWKQIHAKSVRQRVHKQRDESAEGGRSHDKQRASLAARTGRLQSFLPK